VFLLGIQVDPTNYHTHDSSLGALCYYMATHPHAQRQLQAELDTHVPLEPAAEDDEYNDSSLPQANVVANFEQVKGLPYLNACIKEAMRLHTTVSGTGMQRVVPPGKTFTFAGETFKEGSIVSVPSFTTNRAGIWGSDATEFRPERWLEDSSGKLGKYHIPFSLGPR
jgi:benzoate 4-monooxygenase